MENSAHDADSQLAPARSHNMSRFAFRGHGLLVGALQERTEVLAERRQFNAGRLSLEKLAAEFILKLLDGSAERRLRNMAALGGTADMPLVRHR